MGRGRAWAAALTVACVAMAATGCGQGNDPVAAAPPTATATAGEDPEDLTTASFGDPTTIDNAWLPLRPGDHLVLEGTTNEDDELLEHRIVVSVTDLTMVIAGVETVVVWEQDLSDGELVEAELAFYAQDDQGNVWRMGEHPQEIEDGEVIDSPTWIAGIGDGLAGIQMPADPASMGRSWSQGWSLEAEFTDRARFDATADEDCVAAGCFDDVLVTEESNPDEPGLAQLKTYARGVGNIRVDWRGDDPSQEELELVEHRQLDASEMAEVHDAALEVATRGREIDDTFAQTPEIVRP